MDLAGLQIEVDAVQGFDARKDLRDAAQLQNGNRPYNALLSHFSLGRRETARNPAAADCTILLSRFPNLDIPRDFGDFLHFCRSALYNLHNVANHVLEESVLFPSYLV
jgi:hypothetical protein